MPVYYTGKTATDAADFKKSNNYNTFKKEYQDAINNIITFVEVHGKINNSATVNRFIEFKERKVFGDHTPDLDSHQYYLQKNSIETIAGTLTPDESESQLVWLTQLSESINLCAEGSCRTIKDTAESLEVTTGSLSTKAKHLKKQIIADVFVYYIKEHRSRIIEKLAQDLVSNGRASSVARATPWAEYWVDRQTVHLAMSYQNALSPEYGLENITDQHGILTVTEEDKTAVRKQLNNKLNAWHITAILAEQYLQSIKKGWEENPEHPDKELYANKLIKDRIPGYGEFLLSAIFSYDEDDVMQEENPFRENPFRIQAGMAQQLADSAGWEKETLTDISSGETLERIGDLIWKGDPNELEPPDIKNLINTHYLQKIAPGLLHQIIRTASHEDILLLSQQNADWVSRADLRQVTDFLNKLDSDDTLVNALAWAKKHADLLRIFSEKIRVTPCLPSLWKTALLSS